jgi:hypothetical protein
MGKRSAAAAVPIGKVCAIFQLLAQGRCFELEGNQSELLPHSSCGCGAGGGTMTMLVTHAGHLVLSGMPRQGLQKLRTSSS